MVRIYIYILKKFIIVHLIKEVFLVDLKKCNQFLLIEVDIIIESKQCCANFGSKRTLVQVIGIVRCFHMIMEKVWVKKYIQVKNI